MAAAFQVVGFAGRQRARCRGVCGGAAPQGNVKCEGFVRQKRVQCIPRDFSYVKQRIAAQCPSKTSKFPIDSSLNLNTMRALFRGRIQRGSKCGASYRASVCRYPLYIETLYRKLSVVAIHHLVFLREHDATHSTRKVVANNCHMGVTTHELWRVIDLYPNLRMTDSAVCLMLVKVHHPSASMLCKKTLGHGRLSGPRPV